MESKEMDKPQENSSQVDLIVRWFCLKYLPLYIRIWPTYHWIAIWSGPMYPVTHWQALRITLRYGKYHSRLMNVIKKGTI